MKWSIRRRLLSWLFSGIVLASAAGTAAVYIVAREEVDELFDRQLRQIALSLRTQQDLNVSPSESDTSDEDEEGIVVSAWDPNGKPLFGLATDMPPLVRGNIGYASSIWKGQPWRFYTAAGSGGTVVAAQPLAARAHFALGINVRILLPLLGLMLALGLLVWISVGRGLQPLSQIADAMGARTANALDAISAANPPDEIVPFIRALNDLLHRLRQELTKQAHFVADATHELRTPLAALRLQLELVQSADNDAERNAALVRLRAGLERIIHLANQLLTIARLEPAACGQLECSDLSELTVSVVSELWSLAKAKNIDLGVVNNEHVIVAGDAEALRIMLTNIVENAIRYTPSGGRVDVSLRQDGAKVSLEVMDTGSGIPVGERERVFDRFYRGIGQTTPGSGLGLAIVKSIAHRCGADISLQDGDEGRGLRFRVLLNAGAIPRYAPSPDGSLSQGDLPTT